MRRSFTVAVLAFLLTAAGAVSAQDDPRKVQAAPIFEEGRRLAEKGQNAESLERFKKAYAIYPSPNSLFNVARQEQLLGHRLEAIRDYREALRNSVLLPAAATLARTYVAELEQVLGRVKILGPEGARVTVDGRDHTLPLSEPIDVEPGAVAIKGSHAGEDFATSAEVLAGGVATVSLGPKAPPAVDGRATPVEPLHDETSSSSPARWILPVGLGVATLGVLAMGIGFASGSNSAFDRASAENAAKGGTPCSDRVSASCGRYDDALSTAHTDRTWSYVGYVGAFALGAATIATIAFWPKSSSTMRSIRVQPVADLQGGALSFFSLF